MKEWDLKALNEQYELDLDKAVKLIEENDAKRVLLQFPDGLKQYATSIVDYLESKTNGLFFIWLGSCFGACDTPVGLDSEFDLMIQIGHNSLMPNYLV